jgi:putative intracellular protease/amidase
MQKQLDGLRVAEKGRKFPVDVKLESVTASDYYALLLPGGVANPDKLRMIPQAVKVIKGGLVTSRKPNDIPAFNKEVMEEFGRAAHRSAGAQRKTA